MDVIFCAGGNRRFAEIAISEGMKYGTRHDYKPYWPPFFVDINWESYDWNDYLSKIARWQPTMAMVPDYEHPEQQGSMRARAAQLVALGVERVMVCPKFVGAALDIPEWCTVAVSVPTRDKGKYKGWLPPVSDLIGRKLHLLGGSPRSQLDLIRYYAGHGIEVTSRDINMHMKAATRGTFYTARRSVNMGAGAVSTDDAFRRSCKAIMAV